MMNYSNSRYYKVISLLIKTAILILSALYIINKINSSNLINYFKSDLMNWNYFYLSLILVFLNWGMEAYKWKFLIQKVEKLSFITSLKSVLSGVTIGIFTPNRVGEFAGRVFYLDYENKIQATLISFIGSAFQLLVTVLMGFLAAYLIAIDDEIIKIKLLELFSSFYFIVALIVLLGLIILFIIFKEKIKVKYNYYVEVLFNYSIKELGIVFTLSFFRFVIFSLQYYLILKCFSIELDFWLSLQLIAVTFLFSSAIPTFAFTEITVRGASAMYFFGLYLPDTSLILASSMIVWLINLAFPSIVGAFFIWKLKFFKE